jgi:class 3 adenylate cyclase
VLAEATSLPTHDRVGSHEHGPGALRRDAYHSHVGRQLAAPRIRFWQRLSTRVAALFVIAALLIVGLVGIVIYEEQQRELVATLGELLLNIARTGAFLIDPSLHADVQRTLTQQSSAYLRVREALLSIQDGNRIDTPTYTLTDFDPVRRQARFMVTSRGPGLPGEIYPLVPALMEPLRRAFREGVATHTPIYKNQSGTWITAFAPIMDGTGRVIAVLDVDYRVDVFLQRLAGLRRTILGAVLGGALGALVLGVLAGRTITRPLRALTSGVARVGAGDYSEPLPVRSSDEVGQLTRAFNAMLDGLKQRDFIRDIFGRYVSPEVAQTLLESPKGLRLGGEKREITVLMSDLRGYTRFAEQGDPQRVMEVLNGYLARMTDIIIEYGGTINEFIGDAVFAVFGAPLAHRDHAEAAAATALAMQRAMFEINAQHGTRGFPRFEMGIGVNTGEAVVGNIGSKQRAKYAVVGAAVNLASRIEGCTVGGQIFISPSTYARIRDLAEVAPPVPIQLKGITEPLLLYELHGISGRFAQRLPEAAIDPGPQVEVTLPVTCHVIDGKVVREASISGAVMRLGTRQIDARLGEGLAPLTNVRFRIGYPGLGHDSGDLYGKVIGEEVSNGGRITHIRLTSVDPVDQKILEQFLGD